MTSNGGSIGDRLRSLVPGVWTDLERWQQRAINTIVAVVALILVTSILYHYVMIYFEGRSPAYGHSLQVVVETYTGTGYGSDSPWAHPIANGFVVLMDLSTFLLLFIVVPYVFRPVLERAMSPDVPRSTAATDHVVVCGHTQQGDRLLEEFEAREVPYVLIAETEAETVELKERGFSVLHGDPTSATTLQRAGIDRAQSVVVDMEDEQSASAVLAVRELDESIRTVVLVEDLEHERHLRYAGADRVMTPRHLLGRRIAERIRTEISPTRSDTITLGGDFSVLELTVFEGSPIHGETIESIGAAAEGDVTVIGLWQGGTFVGAPDLDVEVDEQTVLLVAGTETELEALETEAYRGRSTEPSVVIAGSGIVGRTVERELQGSTAECTIVDVVDGENVDVVGDATEEQTLREANVEEATVLVVAIADDDEAILSVLIADELGSDLDIIVRVNDPENHTKLRRAGADYVLSLPEISGRILAREVLHEEILSYNRQLKIVRTDASPLAGTRLGDTEIRESDCLIAAIERGDRLLTEFGDDFELQDGDRLLVVGSDEAVDDIVGGKEEINTITA